MHKMKNIIDLKNKISEINQYITKLEIEIESLKKEKEEIEEQIKKEYNIQNIEDLEKKIEELEEQIKKDVAEIENLINKAKELEEKMI